MTGGFRSLPRLMLPALWAGALLGGCVYYNGMYNANRLANSARKAEREGRTFEANNLWGQVATKAESVVVRHPRSKYAEEAMILRGLALAQMEQCEQALGPLNRIGVARVGSDLTEDAWLAMGRCHASLGNVAAADAAFGQVLDSKNASRRREARYQRVRTLRVLGRYEEALNTLEGAKDPRVLPELLLSLAGAGRVPEAMALADSLIARGDTTQRWDSLVVALAQQNPSSASGLVDRLRRLPGRTPEAQARSLLADGVRLIETDTARASARFREAVKLGGGGDAARMASLELVKLDLRTVSEPSELTSAAEKLRQLGRTNKSIELDVNQLGSTVRTVLAASDSSVPGSPQGDLRLFLAAEAARDSLQAPRLAEGFFLRIVNDWPDSPYAPKAVLAAQQLNPGWADSARSLLEARYFYSPYLSVIRGEDDTAYRQLEDSLAAFAAGGSGTPQRTRPGAPNRAPIPSPDDTAGRRRPQPGVRVPQP